ncbi:conserved protein of unknown function [Pararobbsia alpina]|uniref:hypothetical protein n=1 Tax=Pararobbsia alpina TaxID=621374 RepID=UPI0039A5E089
MTPDPSRPTSDNEATERASRPDPEHFHAALGHVESQYGSGHLAASAARGLVYSIVETLGALVGDPDLPEHARSGYQGLLESARELRTKIGE